MYPENPEGTQVIVGSMNMGYISDTPGIRTHNLVRPKQEPIPLGHSRSVGMSFSKFLSNNIDAWGPSIKYVTLQRGEGVWESVTVCDRGRGGGGKDHVTSHFPFFHNSQFYVLFYILI